MKATLAVCLFLLSGIAKSQSHQIVRNAFYHAHFEEAIHHFKKRVNRTWQSGYYGLYASSLKAVLAGDERAELTYDRFIRDFEVYLDTLNAKDEHLRFLEIELNLQRSIVKGRFSHEFEALLSFRKAINLLDDAIRLYPESKPLLKSKATVQVMLGSVPESYHWMLSLMGWQGSITEGLEIYESLATDGEFAIESVIQISLIQSYLLDERSLGEETMRKIYKSQDDKMLIRYVYMLLLSKSRQADKIVEMTDYLDPTAIVQMYYLVGESYLQKGLYESALNQYATYLDYYPGRDLVKDTYFKSYLAYLLMGKTTHADSVKGVARLKGNIRFESDRYASYNLGSSDFNLDLLKARLAFDGGFYSIAQQHLNSFTSGGSKYSLKQKCESVYRQARIDHATGQTDRALRGYRTTHECSKERSWYFGANSALQTGVIKIQNGENEEALSWLKRAVSYRDHEYKSSIDRKAKSMISAIESSQRQ